MRSTISAGFIGILFLILLVGIGSFYLKLDNGFQFSGIISVEKNRRVVQHFEGGIIQSIFIKEGDFVKKGQPIIQLDRTTPEASLKIIRSNLNQGEAIEARLIAERSFSDKIIVPKLSSTLDPQTEIESFLADQYRIMKIRRDSIKGETDILKKRIQQLDAQISGYLEVRQANQQQLALMAQELDALEKLLADGNTTMSRVVSLRRDMEQLKGQQGDQDASIARSKEEISATKIEISQVTKKFLDDVNKQLKETQKSNFELKAREINAKDILTRTTIRSPVSGEIVDIAVNTIGGVIIPGKAVVDLIPSDDQLVVEGKVQPSDVDKVKVGDEVSLQIQSLHSRTLSPIKGVVSLISADKLSDTKNNSEYFNVRISFVKNSLSALRGFRLNPGMPVSVSIPTGELSAFTYLLKKIRDFTNKSFRN